MLVLSKFEDINKQFIHLMNSVIIKTVQNCKYDELKQQSKLQYINDESAPLFTEDLDSSVFFADYHDFNFENEKLAKAFFCLDKKKQDILQYFYVEDLKIFEIAKIMNTTPNAITKQKIKAIQQIKDYLDN